MCRVGFEPTRPFEHRVLNAASLPFHHRHFIRMARFELATSRFQTEGSGQTELHPVIGTVGFEPTTTPVRGECATRLRYAPLHF